MELKQKLINKYSTILYQRKLKDMCKKEGRDYYRYGANKYLFLFVHILKQKEIDNICKELDIKSFKAYI